MSENLYFILSGLMMFAALFLVFLLWRDSRKEIKHHHHKLKINNS